MTINTTTNVNQATVLYFQAASGITDFTPIRIFKDGVVSTEVITGCAETASTGLYKFTFTPIGTGRYAIYYPTNFIAYIEVVAKNVYTYLKNIEDECLGSWVWNKQLGTLNMIRQDGTPLAAYRVVEDLAVASRERTG